MGNKTYEPEASLLSYTEHMNEQGTTPKTSPNNTQRVSNTRESATVTYY